MENRVIFSVETRYTRPEYILSTITRSREYILVAITQIASIYYIVYTQRVWRSTKTRMQMNI